MNALSPLVQCVNTNVTCCAWQPVLLAGSCDTLMARRDLFKDPPIKFLNAYRVSCIETLANLSQCLYIG